jgi:predicted transcriptional regulator
MDIRSVMTANPTTCSPDATLRQVAQLMKQNDCGQIPVVGQDSPAGGRDHRSRHRRACRRPEAVTSRLRPLPIT